MGADDVTECRRLLHARVAATYRRTRRRSVPQLPPNAVVAVTRPPPPGEGHKQGTVVQVHSDSGIRRNRQPKRDSFRDSQPVKVVQQRRYVVKFPGAVYISDAPQIKSS